MIFLVKKQTFAKISAKIHLLRQEDSLFHNKKAPTCNSKFPLNHKWEPLPNLQILFLVLFLFCFNFRFFSSAPAFLFCFRFHIPNIINDNLLIWVQGSIQGIAKFTTVVILERQHSPKLYLDSRHLNADCISLLAFLITELDRIRNFF